MRVVQINSYSNGSTGHIAASIHQALLENGDSSLFAYGSGPEIVANGYHIGNYIEEKMHTIFTLFFGLHGYCSILSTHRLIRELKKFQPDIVHLHNLHGSYLNLRILFNYLRKKQIQTVITVHDCWLYTGKCYHYYEAKCNKYLKHCGNCPQLSMYPKSYCFDFTSKMLSDKRRWIGSLNHINVVTISEWLQKQVKETFLGKYPVTMIRNGASEVYKISEERPSAAIEELFSNRFVILGVASSWNPHKGILDFVRLAEFLADDEVIVLVGHIKDDVKLPGNIISIDRAENMRELLQIYNLASVYVSMSTEETFGLTIAESLCCGTPAIVYDATACPEMIHDGVNGYVVSPHDVPEVYKRINMIKNTTSMNRYGIAKEAREKYSVHRMVSDYLRLYRGVLK